MNNNEDLKYKLNACENDKQDLIIKIKRMQQDSSFSLHENYTNIQSSFQH